MKRDAAPIGSPAAEVELDVPFARRLLEQQHPDLAPLPLRLADEGFDNVVFRLGEALALRMPRRAEAEKLIEHEQRWLPELAARLPVEVPAHVRTGQPALGYPFRWSVVPWFEGTTADQEELAAGEAERFGAFLRTLHREAPADAPRGGIRGVPLDTRRELNEERMRRLRGTTPLVGPALERVWRRALEAPIDAPDTWIHGDLHARNVLTRAGRLVAVIDWGEVAVGDAATDLASMWMLFDSPEARETLLAARGGASRATLDRARGWAVHFGVALLESGRVDHPAHARMGERTLGRLVEEEEAALPGSGLTPA